MVVATFDLKLGDADHRMTFCLPFSGLLPHLVRAAAPAPVSDRERVQRAQAAALLHEQFHDVPLDVRVRCAAPACPRTTSATSPSVT